MFSHKLREKLYKKVTARYKPFESWKLLENKK